MPRGTAFHSRTAPLNRVLAWRDWSGYFAAARYRDHHGPEYAAIRQAVALIDVSPLFKYRVRGRQAEWLIDRLITRDASRLAPGQVAYTPWCDERGRVCQEGTVFRHREDLFQVNATEASLHRLQLLAEGLDAEVEDRSDGLATVAVQGPASRALLADIGGSELAELPFFRHASCRLDGLEVAVSRTGYTGDLGYELWVDADDAPRLWDTLIAAGRPYGASPCGLEAMDVARIEAGFVLLGVDYVGAERAVLPSQTASPYEIGLGWAVHLDAPRPFVGRPALAREKAAGSPTALVGLEVAWEPLERLYAEAGLMPELPKVPWRTAVPVYADRRQVGRATSGCWSTTLKRLIALATVERRYAEPGSELGLEVTVDYRRRQAPATVARLPFFNPERMRG